jgi:DNA polymerase-3 subunit epsilon
VIPLHTSTRRHFPRFIAIGSILLLLCGILAALWVELTTDEKLLLRRILEEHPALILTAVFLFPSAVVIAVLWVFQHYIEPLRKLVDDVQVINLINPSHRLTGTGSTQMEQLCAAINRALDRIQDLQLNADEHARNSFRQVEEENVLPFLDRPLTEIPFTAFDTETTGLRPSEGDEIVSIGGVRIVHGKMLREETFDQLVDPGRPISHESTQVHGIDDVMVRGQPDLRWALPAFSRFAQETVLVGHNAAFDMRFFQIKEEPIGVKLGMPVLDTMLLSAAVHPHHEDHSIEGIAGRLGVNTAGRHTALGDAIVTGELFLKLIPLLADKGIRTLGEAMEASKKTYLARVKY